MGFSTSLDYLCSAFFPSSRLRITINVIAFTTTVILVYVLRQLLPQKTSGPPLVFHWIPFTGSALSYDLDPFAFYTRCREKHGVIFTFVLFGRKITVYLGKEGNKFIFGGKLQDVNAEEICSPLTTPVFGLDIIYDCPNAKLMEQKKFVKSGLTHNALCSYVPLIEQEVIDYLRTAACFQGSAGEVNIPAAMAEITIFTASRTLQGQEVRDKLSAHFADIYHDFDLGFRPINLLMPWAPLLQNRRRDAAHAKMRAIYIDIINKRRRSNKTAGEDTDMMWHLMSCVYKNGQPLPDKEIAQIMITLLMAGQHSSSSSSSWIMLRLASCPDILEELYQEQVRNLGYNGSQPLQYSDIDKLPLLQNVIKETLRVYSSIHSLMRQVIRSMPVPNSELVIQHNKVLVSSSIMSHMSEEHFPNAHVWNPHRWDNVSEAENEEDVVESEETKSLYLPFRAGRHRCISEKFAYVNLCTIISTLVRNMKFSTMDGESWVPPTDYTSFSRPSQPAVVRWERRCPGS